MEDVLQPYNGGLRNTWRLWRNVTTPEEAGFLVTATAQTITFVPYETAVNQGFTTIASLRNKNGDVAVLGSATMTQACAAATMTQPYIADSAAPAAWPLTWMTALWYHHQNGSNCPNAQTLIRFFNWANSNDLARGRSTQFGHVSLAPTLQTNVATLLAAATCSGNLLLSGGIAVKGTGATFPNVLYQEWTYLYRFVDPTTVVQYTGTGSGAGQTAILTNTHDFGGSDAPLTHAQMVQGGDLLMVPTTAGAAVFAYNLPGTVASAPLILTRELCAAIFLSTVTKWNDPMVVAANPHLAGLLPDQPIYIVYRADKSGTTHILTAFLTSVSSAWATGAGLGDTQLVATWPFSNQGRSTGATGSTGVVATVVSTPYSIGYCELQYAQQSKLRIASMRNKAGNVVVASTDALQSAIDDFATSPPPYPDHPLVKELMDAPGAHSWPMASYSYLMIRTRSYADCDRTKRLMKYIVWTIAATSASALDASAALGYAPLPKSVNDAVMAALNTVSCGGSLVLSTCADGEVFNATLYECVPCGRGNIAVEAGGQRSCQRCVAGTFSANLTATNCTPCAVDTYSSSAGATSCTTCPDLTGTYGGVGAFLPTNCSCLEGTYTFGPDTRCNRCPSNAKCTGGLKLPAPNVGFWSAPSTPGLVQACRPPEVCLGNSQCREGHAGTLCASCQPSWYMTRLYCATCPNLMAVRVLFLVAFLLFLMVFPFLIRQERLMTAQITSIGASFVQVTTIIGILRLAYPEDLKFFLQMLSPVNWMLAISPPACTLSVGWFFTWGVRVMLPFLFLFLAGGGFVFVLVMNLVARMIRRWCSCCCRNTLMASWLDGFIHLTSLTTLKYTIQTIVCSAVAQFYVFFSQASLEYFKCFDDGSGTYRLEASPSIECYKGEWQTYLPFAVVAGVINMIVAPALIILVLTKTNKYYDYAPFKNKFGYLYLRYKRHRYWWEVIVLGRKLMCAVVGVYLSSTPRLAAFLMGCVLVLNGIAQQHHQPFVHWGANLLEQLCLFGDALFVLCATMFTPVDTINSDALAYFLISWGFLILTLIGVFGFAEVFGKRRACWRLSYLVTGQKYAPQVGPAPDEDRAPFGLARGDTCAVLDVPSPRAVPVEMHEFKPMDELSDHSDQSMPGLKPSFSTPNLVLVHRVPNSESRGLSTGLPALSMDDVRYRHLGHAVSAASSVTPSPLSMDDVRFPLVSHSELPAEHPFPTSPPTSLYSHSLEPPQRSPPPVPHLMPTTPPPVPKPQESEKKQPFFGEGGLLSGSLSQSTLTPPLPAAGPAPAGSGLSVSLYQGHSLAQLAAMRAIG